MREGRVYIDIARERPEDDQSVIEISWREEDGPPVAEPRHSGSGLEVIQELLAYELDAKVDSASAPEGFRCKVRVPISRLAAKTQAPFEVPG